MTTPSPITVAAGVFSVLLVAARTATFAQTWTPTPSPSTNWGCLTSCADGTELFAGTDQGLDYLWISTNAGAGWTLNPSLVGKWFSLAVSAEGATVFAADGQGGLIHVSTNHGVA